MLLKDFGLGKHQPIHLRIIHEVLNDRPHRVHRPHHPRRRLFFSHTFKPERVIFSDSTAWSSTNSERFFTLAHSPPWCTADLAPSMSSENTVRPCIIIAVSPAPPFVSAGEGNSDGNNDWLRTHTVLLTP